MNSSETTIGGVAVEVGGMAILLRAPDASFRHMLESRYAGFVNPAARPQFVFDIDLQQDPAGFSADDEVQVYLRDGCWMLQRGDFRAEWDPAAGRGRIRQSPNPYAIDSVLRIVHTLILAPRGGFLVHAASAIRNGSAFLFAGVSGAGKTTISRLAPPDAILLSDEVSYVQRDGNSYRANGTPFAGELAQLGENRAAPLGVLFLLEKGPENRIENVDKVTAMRLLLRNILFFARDPGLVKLVFRSVSEFVDRVPVRRLTFAPDTRVWEMIC
jgi:hypothetical protein